MKHFIEFTSIKGNTRAFRVDTILQVVNQKVFSKEDYETSSELKEKLEWVYIDQQCNAPQILRTGII
ncbi:hypothetical protein H8788_14345 [Parabacteroides faecis]|uniref:hypothetical protein n=1 Tax=Parabacteroides TaxID=375288 RepID=UPI000EFF76F1|nr:MULTISPECIES: hypothetical protein [Parabacteroides]MBC8618922.1 hypothetical protein [Parabacteroides faecis]RHS00043.1 hypothetical protein DWW23_05220 [Parabacteroides sp. AF14-59]